jgi:hypothetical protein
MKKVLFFTTGLLFIGLIINASVLAANVPAPVGYWLFDGDVLDSSGNENHGKIIGKLKWVEGKFGKAVEFPGTELNYISVADSKSLNPTEQFSITCWVNPATSEGDPRIVSKDDETVGRDYLLASGINYIEFGTWHADSSRSLLDTAQGLENDKWQHLAGTFDGSNVVVYVDGEEIGKMAAVGKGMKDTNVPLVFGYYTENVRPYAYQGVLDDVAIFDVALSLAEIKAVMNGDLYRKVSAVYPSNKLAFTWGAIKNQ